MKRFFTLVLAAAMTAALSGCGAKKEATELAVFADCGL